MDGGVQTENPESIPENAEGKDHPRDRAAPDAAVGAENAPIDPDLQVIIDQWPDMSEAVKAGILAMVKAADAPRTEHDRAIGTRVHQTANSPLPILGCLRLAGAALHCQCEPRQSMCSSTYINDDATAPLGQSARNS